MQLQKFTNLSIPSVIFADASWYGSLRGGVEFGGGNDANFKDGVSRWGIKGSSEISDGLSAVYRFESKVSTNDGSQPGGRLAYAGLSGGFGSVTLGQIWNAAYNHVGSITDGSWFYGDAHTGYRHGNAVSYAYSGGAMSLQLDAILDGGMNTDSAVDKLEFGMTIDLGDIGKVALAHTNKKDTQKSMTFVTTEAADAIPAVYQVTVGDGADAMTHEVEMIPVTIAKNSSSIVDGQITTAGLALIQRNNDGYHLNDSCVTDDDAANNACITKNVWVSTETTTRIAREAGDDANTTTTTTVHETFHRYADAMMKEGTGIAAVEEETEDRTVVDANGHKKNHIAVQIGVGGLTTYLGHTTVKTNNTNAEDKITHYGISGGLGDSGISFHAMGRSKKLASGMKKNPWLLGFTKGLGGGATAMIEHGNNDDGKSGKTRIGLKVDF